MRPRKLKRRLPKLGGWPAHKLALVGFSALAIVSLLLSGIFVQTKANDVTHDERLVDTIVELESVVNDYYDDESELPDELSELEGEETQDLVKKAEDLNVEYDSESSRSFELCGTFKTDQSQDDSESDYRSSLRTPENDVSSHGEGRECFDYSVGFGVERETTPTTPSFDSFLEQPTLN